MIVTIEQLREYARNLDNRLEDTAKFNDTWLDHRIEEGLAVAQDIKPVFFTKETYDLTFDIIDNGLEEVEIVLQKEPHSLYEVVGDPLFWDILPTANNHIVVKRVANIPVPDDMTIEVKYFFYVTLPVVTVEMTMEMYRLIKDGIAIILYSWLRDKESEQYHQAKAESYIIKGTFDLEKGMIDSSDTLLWSRSWA